jgi:hypothetical protein
MFNNTDLSARRGQSATMGVGTWMAFDCISLLHLIPILGTIAVLIIYLIILFGSQTAPSLRNRIVANLIWVAIAIGVYIAVIVLLLATGSFALITDSISRIFS